ncbi:hypothetical protein PIB30_040399 [Stylosanthes scabra]|uniref:Uncharacterized protein n=1 Tax=Stylosanthes scabra TaxID=79078 RepID=A0ABU6QDZ5_9FABA|nr:hypothetical protein [Stylosanthes scabra]
MRGKPTAHVPESRLDKPKRDPDPHKPHSSTHRRRRPTHMRGRHLGSKQPQLKRDLKMLSPLQSHAYAQDSQHMRGRQTQPPSSSSPHICVEASICVEAIQAKGQDEDPRIGVEVHLMRGSSKNSPRDNKFHAYALSPTHMHGKQNKTGAELSFP